MAAPTNVELNEQFQRALTLMENSSAHVFVTGKAGTGKSTLLEYFRAHTRKKVAVLAPTGVAALNVRGQTIHAFFRFQADVTVDKVLGSNKRKGAIYKKLDAIVVDEISMVRADILDCMDAFLRLHGPKEKLPFGGVQMILIGDLHQLPPVVSGEEKEAFRQHYQSEYFFDAKVFGQMRLEFIELEKIYRQKDQEFIRFLNAVRNNTVNDKDLALINTRVNAHFQADPRNFFLTVTPTNALAAEINKQNLGKIPGQLLTYHGSVEGQFGNQYLPTDTELMVKVGAQVMMVNNDSHGRWVNGSIGHLQRLRQIEGEADDLLVKLSDGGEEWVQPYTWELFKLSYNDQSKSLESQGIGSFTQYPFRLAWAVTIHKSQGKTFQKVIIDFGHGMFAHGQAYVALSRCTSLDGVVLKRPLEKRHVSTDWRVERFLKNV